MAKTNVILIKNVEGLGAESDQVNVATGFARNYLLPQGLAIPLTQGNERHLEALRKQRQERELLEAKDAKELAAGFKHLMLIIKAKTGDNGKMYGSVTPSNIVEQLKHQFDVKIERKKLHIDEPIRSIGDHNVEVRLHSDVSTTLKVRVESSNPLPESTGNEAKVEEAKESTT
jgi:large subunit ribosomal protein L9|tara:strand:+ start:111 stop:629 length:519 start_codon:yes stop_codon:yes gene_type:complete